MKNTNIFALIIGTEILNGRREDAHFAFLRDHLKEHGHTLTGSFVIKDDPALITKTIAFIASQQGSYLIGFGGIGSTPDDHTRQCAANALGDGKLYEHDEAKRIIEGRLGSDAYPHPIKMAMLPRGAKLIENPINQMPAFYLDDRYFFLPGFPEMSRPMVEWIIAHKLPKGRARFRKTLMAKCKENLFIPLMEQAPKGLEISSLPAMTDSGYEATLSIEGENKKEVESYFQLCCKALKRHDVDFKEIEER